MNPMHPVQAVGITLGCYALHVYILNCICDRPREKGHIRAM